jgi:hypothetical protein
MGQARVSHRIVTDEQLSQALDWLRDNAAAIGNAKHEAVLTEKMGRHIKALEMKKHSELPVSAQEREAYASDAYKKAIYEEAKAAGAFEMMRALREAAALKIEAWRSEQANFRSMKI